MMMIWDDLVTEFQKEIKYFAWLLLIFKYICIFSGFYQHVAGCNALLPVKCH